MVMTGLNKRRVYIPESGFGPMCTDKDEAYRLTCEGLEQALRRIQMLIDAGLWPAPEKNTTKGEPDA